MQVLKRDVKIEHENYAENHFFIERSQTQFVVVSGLIGKHGNKFGDRVFMFQINRLGFERFYRWEIKWGELGARSFVNMVHETMKRFESEIKSEVINKYSSSEFRVG